MRGNFQRVRFLRILIGCAGALALAACSGAEDDKASTGSERSPAALLDQKYAAADAAPSVDEIQLIVADSSTPLVTLRRDTQRWRQLIEAIAGENLFAEVLQSKEQHGRVVDVRAGNEGDLRQAEVQLAAIQARLKRLSQDGTPTYLLLHHIDSEGHLAAFLLDSEGGLGASTSQDPYEGLDFLVEGLGVARLASTRAPIERGKPEPTEAQMDALRAADQTPAAKADRVNALGWAREILMPGAILYALSERSGRILVKGVRDSETAPYAALPLEDGPAAQRFSFVTVPDLDTLVAEDGVFEFDQLDLKNAVIVGDPDLSSDRNLKWKRLPAAMAEAQYVSRKLGGDELTLLTGKQATRSALTRAISSTDDLGMVYIASHAIADPENPLTRGFVAMSGHGGEKRGGHYFAGHIRQEKFSGWEEHNPLVVMSACQTALGRVFNGGGFGIARSWTTVGAGQVVSSLWNVSDNATKVLMTHFVNRIKAGDPPEIAMQKAQLKTMQAKTKSGSQPYLDDPKMWASFSIYGKPSG